MPIAIQKDFFWAWNTRPNNNKVYSPVQEEGLLVRAKSKEEGIFVDRFLRELVLRNLQTETQALLFQKNIRSPFTSFHTHYRDLRKRTELQTDY